MSDNLKLRRINMSKNYATIVFISYLRADFIDKMLKISINRKNRIIEQLYFSSNNFGTTTWTNHEGIVDAHRWENEDTAHNLSYLAKHYPTLLLNGQVNESFARNEIINDVLVSLDVGNLRTEIEKIIDNNVQNYIFDPSLYNLNLELEAEF